MNEGQKKFYDFIIERVKPDSKQSAVSLLKDSFSRQADGTFDSGYLKTFIPELLKMIQPEYTCEVNTILQNYKPDKIKE